MAKIDGYKFGAKNNWRRWAWNRISERLKVPVEDAIVLYLPGSEDLDRKVACEHGFRPENLIGVDRDHRVVEKMRANGKLCLEGDYLDAARSLIARSVSIDVAIVDLCCGLTDSASQILMTLPIILANGSIICANMLRGRDKSDLLSICKEHDDSFAGIMKPTKSRSEYLYRLYIQLCVSYSICRYGHGMNNWRDIEEFDPSTATEKDKSMILPLMITYNEVLRPAQFSYKSGPQIFDSLVVQIPFDNDGLCKNPTGILSNISAILATRTMRMNGTLPRCPSE